MAGVPKQGPLRIVPEGPITLANLFVRMLTKE